MIRSLEQKLEFLKKTDCDIFVITHKKEDGTVEYTDTITGPAGICYFTCLYDNWFEASWHETREAAESLIAESARKVYSVERIRISRENQGAGSVTVTKEPPEAKFKCTCGCEFTLPIGSCEQTLSDLEGETRIYQTIAFWAKCPKCGHSISRA